MATHSSFLAWKIPWTEEPGGLPSMEMQRVRHDQAAENKGEWLQWLMTQSLQSQMGSQQHFFSWQRKNTFSCFMLLFLLFSCSGCVQLFATAWTAAHQASLFFTISYSLLKLMSIKSEMPSNHLIFCHPLLLLPSIFPSIRVFSNESVLPIRWPEYQSFSFSISPPHEYSGLISFRIDQFDLLAD